jgi:dienelactone hydrolase
VTNSTTIREPCDCYRDLPLDTDHGPYPVIIFLHGFSGFSAQSVVQMTHWASRGFVVIAADHPSIGLKTLLTNGIGGLDLTALSSTSCDLASAGKQTQEAVGELDALQDPTGDLAFLAGHIDMTRVGASGHSAGAFGVSPLSTYKNVQVVAPMAGAGVCPSSSLRSSLIMGGMQDSIVAYSRQQSGFGTTPTPKRLVGLENAGHMAFTAFCPIGKDQGGILQAAMNAGVMFDPSFISLVGPLAADGCGASNLDPARGWQVIDFATAGVFEETLFCLPERAAELSRIRELFPDAVGDFHEEL